MSTQSQEPSRPVVQVRARTRIVLPPATQPTPAKAAVPIMPKSRFRPVAAPPAPEPQQPASAPEASAKAAQPEKRDQARGDRTGPNWQDGDYKVGKGRPPVEYRIKPGEVRNKRGPKRGDVNFIKRINKELDKKLPIKRGNKMVPMDTIAMLGHNLRAMVAEKNLGAMKLALELKLKGEELKGSGETPSLSASQWAMIDEVLKQAGYDAEPVVRKKPGGQDEPG